FRDALETAPTTVRGRRGPMLGVAAAVVAMLIIVGIVVARRQRAAPLDQNLVAVAPFDVVDADLKLWHEGIVDVLSRNLDGAGPLRTVSPTLVLRRWTGRADKESAQLLGQATGARLAVFGRLIRSGADSVRASASIIDVASGNVLGEVDRRDGLSRMDRLSDSLTIGLLRELAKTRALGGAQMSSVGTTSLPALKAFLQGQQFFRRSAWDSAVAYFDKAVAIDSTFSVALTLDGAARGWSGGVADTGAVDMMSRAARFNHGLAPRDSFLVLAGGKFAELGASTTAPPFKAQEELFQTLHEGVRRYPNDPELWYLLGDAQYHWGWGQKVGVPESEVVRSFDRAIALDSAFTPAYIHAIEMGFRYGTANGRRYLKAYLAQNPTDVDAAGMRLADRLTDPALAGSAETRHMLDTASALQMQHAAVGLIEWPDSGETVVQMGRILVTGSRGPSQRITDSLKWQRRQALALSLRGHLREAVAMHRNSELLGVAMIAGETPTAPADSFIVKELAAGHGCGPCAMSLWGMMGDTAMIHLLTRMGDSVAKLPHPPIDVRLIDYTLAVGRAYLTLAHHDTAGALRAFAALPDSLCHGCSWSFVTQAQLLASQGRNAEAAAILDESSVLNTAIGTLAEFERARVAEKLGDKARARDGYAFVAGMWQNGDTFFERIAEDSRAGLKRLSGDNSSVRIPLKKP
ncbi:MAG: hypothetical protein ABIQ10_08375, partial [Gemmatimonadaceae bacterium]